MAKYNMNFGKITGDYGVEYAPSPLVIDGENVWTNIPETYFAQGYYPVIKTEMPEKEGYHYISYWEQENGSVVQKWEEHEIPPEPIAEVATEEDINQAIQEGVNSIDN